MFIRFLLTKSLKIGPPFVLVRKWKKKATLGVKETKWEFEVGEQLVPRNLDSEGMLESSANVRARNIWVLSKNGFQTVLYLFKILGFHLKKTLKIKTVNLSPPVCRSQSQQKKRLSHTLIILSYIAYFLIFYQQHQSYLYKHIKRVNISWIIKEMQKKRLSYSNLFPTCICLYL